MSSLLSVLIPSRNEQFLPQTIADLFAKAAGEIEIICCLDGYWPSPPLPEYPNLHIIHRSQPRGMRAAINAAASIAKGKYLMKTDAHCMFDEGFDEVLKANCDDNWVVIPSRYSLDAENWCWLDTGKSRVDYHYLCCPFKNKKDNDPGLHGVEWRDRARERKDKPEFDIDDEMSFQGSLWFTPKAHFERIGGLPEEEYGGFIQEPQQLGLKTWLSGGRVVTNKLTSYHHLHKGNKYGRGYVIGASNLHQGSIYSTDYWLNDRWPGRVHNFEWLIEKFWPVPSWPDNWQDEWQRLKHHWRKENGHWVFDYGGLQKDLGKYEHA
jgi:glycosyltransferase involved in cell wall biosynthesis